MGEAMKRFLFKVLGQEGYLKALQTGFFLSYRMGLLKNDPIYKYHYFVKELIRKGDTVVDLGANLGYFSKIFAQLVGPSGKVISIEPVKPFFKILQQELSSYKQSIRYNYALGTEKKIIEMAVPKNYGYLRTGLAHVAQKDNSAETDYLFEVEMMKGSELLSGLDRIDYLKCDIEGYEEYVLPELKPVLEKHLPLIQVETWGTHKAVVMNFLEGLGYRIYTLQNGKLLRIAADNDNYPGDYLLVHPDKEQRIQRFMNNV